MKIFNKISFIAIIFISVFATSCTKYYNPGLNLSEVKQDSVVADETKALHDFIQKSGDYINSAGVPNMVGAPDVYDNLSNYFVIDIRSHQEYVDGHINGAVNVSQGEVIDYMETKVSASRYDKIIIACHTGQTASYVTSLLRLIGYNNVYAMKYGMSSWNKALDKWSNGVSNKYASQLETTDNPKHSVTAFPVIRTGESGPAEILKNRAKEVLNTPFKSVKVNVDEAFSNSSDYYIINYWPKDKYDKGHIPGAIQYTPKHDLNDTTFLKTLPTDKKILVYCFTGQNAAFTVAYLRLLGYDAYTIPFGANAFMHNVLVSREHWHGFKAAEKLNDFPLVTGEAPSDKKINTSSIGNDTPKKTKKKIVKRKKKEVSGGCG